MAGEPCCSCERQHHVNIWLVHMLAQLHGSLSGVESWRQRQSCLEFQWHI